VLVLLLRHFLYRRVVRAMDERETRIDSRLKEAQERKKEAEQEAESYRKKNQELLDRDEELLAKAREEADIWRKKLEENARIEVEENKARWYEAVERQKEAFLIDLRRRAGEQTYIIVRRVLKDLANDDLERQIINTFIKLLANLEDDEKEALGLLSAVPSGNRDPRAPLVRGHCPRAAGWYDSIQPAGRDHPRAQRPAALRAAQRARGRGHRGPYRGAGDTRPHRISSHGQGRSPGVSRVRGFRLGGGVGPGARAHVQRSPQPVAP